jgi:hypothetical protein
MKRCMNELCIEPSKVSRTKAPLDAPRVKPGINGEKTGCESTGRDQRLGGDRAI